MNNCDIQFKGEKMIITVDLKQNFGNSKSGKSQIIATTSGNVTVGDPPVTVGLNVYRKVAAVQS